MKWVARSTGDYSDLRLARAGEAAEILYDRAWGWSGHHEQGGFIPAEMVARLCPTKTKARVSALIREGLWRATDGGYQAVDWDEVYEDVKSLVHRRKSDRDRKRRQRERDDASHQPSAELSDEPSPPESTDTGRDEDVNASRGLSRDSHGAEKSREERTPQPPARRGADCDPISKPHSRCRGCGTTKRVEVQTAAAEAIAAEERRRAAAKNAPHCGDPDCDPHSRWRTTALGVVRCPECHEVSILARTEPVQLALAATA